MANHYPLTPGKSTHRIVPSFTELPESAKRKREFCSGEENNVELSNKRRDLAVNDQRGKHASASRAQVQVGQGLAPTRLPPPIGSEFFDEAFCDEEFGELGSVAPKRPLGDLALNVRDFDKFGDTLLQEHTSVFPTPTKNRPSSSVLHEFDNGNESASNSTVDFDPTLQHSPFPSKSLVPAPYDELPSTNKTDVIWDQVRHHTASNRAVSISPPSVQVKHPPFKKLNQIATQNQVPNNGNLLDGMMLKPGEVWFHFYEMFEAMESTYHNQPNISFELFARVIYSARENFEKKQYFRIRDLFKVKPPYLSGVLAN